MFKLNLLFTFFVVICISTSAKSQAIWYSKGDLGFNTPTNWNSQSNGQGTNATSFASADIYKIQSGHTMVLSASFSSSINIQIENGGSLNLSGYNLSGSGYLQITGFGENSAGAIFNSSTSITSSCSKSLTLLSSSSIEGPGSITISSTIVGGFSLTKSSTGILILSGTNSYSGGTTLSAGTLKIGNNSALGTGTLTINGVGTITIDTDNSTARTISNPLSIGSSFTFTGTANLTQTTGVVTLTASPSITVSVNTLSIGGVISGNSSLTKAGSGTITLSGTNTYSGGTTLSSGTLNIGNDAALGTGTLTINGGTLNTNNTTARTISNPLSIGSSFTFTGTANLTQTTGAVTLTASPTITVSGNTLSIGGVISGAHSLTKAGSGTITLSGTNTYSGGTTLSSGTLNIGNDAALGTGTLTINGGTLNTNNTTARTISNPLSIGSSFTFTGTANLTQTTGAVTLTASPTITVSGNTLSIGGVISGAHSLTKAGSGTLTLSGANAYTGKTSITQGVLSISSDSNLGTQPNSFIADQIILAGGTLNSTSSFTLHSSRGITLNSSSTISPNTSTTLEYAGLISGASNFTKAGSGTLTLSGANTYTGSTTVSAGTLLLGNSEVIPDNSALILSASGATLAMNGNSETIGSIAGVSGSVISTSIGTPTLTFGGDGTNTTFAGVIGSGAISLVKMGSGTITLSGTNTYSGGTTLSAGTLNIGNDAALGTGTFTINGGILNTNGATARTISNPLSIGSSFTFTGTANLTQTTGVVTLTASPSITVSGSALSIGGAISGTSLTKAGSGTLTLSGTNTYSGGTTLSAGTLNIGNDAALGTGTFTINGGTLNTNGATASTISNPLSIGSSFTFTGTANLTQTTGAVTLTASPTITVSGNTLSIGGVISGNSSLTKAGSGTLTLSGANAYTGSTTVSAGTLLLGNSEVIPNNSALNLSVNGATLAMNGNSETIGSIAGVSGSVISTSIGAPTLTFGGDGTNTTFAGVIGSGAISLVKTGSGTITLSGANSYSGATTINAGTIKLGVTNAIPVGNPGAGIILNGGTLHTGSAYSQGTLTTNLGVLTLLENSALILGSTTSHNIYFASSENTSWISGKTLSVSGWNGFGGSSGSGGKIFIGTSANALTNSQLSQISINSTQVNILSTGQIVPKPLIFRSKQSGLWSDVASWESSNDDGVNWSNASVSPNSDYGSILIQSGHTITISSNMAVDQLTIENGATLISNAATLSIYNGEGDDIVVFGLLTNSSSLNISSNGVIKIYDGGTYKHANSYAIPTLSWQNGSTCEIATIPSGGFAQSFYNFTWNCPTQTISLQTFGGSSFTANGVFKVTNTGTGSLAVGNAGFQTNYTFGEFEMTGGKVIVNGPSASFNSTLTVNSNFTLSGGIFEIGNDTQSSGTCQVNGNCTLNSGTINIINNTGNNNSVSLLQINGDLTLNGGTIDLAANSTGTNNGHLFIKGNLEFISGNLTHTRGANGPYLTGSSGIYFDGLNSQEFHFNGGSLSTAPGGAGRRFYFKSSSGPTSLTEVYNSVSQQSVISGLDGSPLSGYVAFNTIGNLTNNLTINGGPILLTSNRVINGELNLENGTLDLINFTLTLNGTITPTGGLLDADQGTIAFGNNTNQSITTSIFTGAIANLSKASGAGTLTLNDHFTIANELSTVASAAALVVASGKQITVNGSLTNEGVLTLKDGATLVQATSGTSISGLGIYNVEKQLAGNAATWNSTSNEGRFWYMGVPMVNVSRSSFGTPGTTTNRLWSYNEVTKQYTDIADGNTMLSAGTGYVHRRNDNNLFTFTASGANGLYGGDLSLNGLTRTAGASAGYHLVSNPYMAYLDWASVTKTNIEPTYYIRSSNTGNISALISCNSETQLFTSNAGVTIDEYNDVRYIAPLQAVWVRVGTSASTGSLSMSRSMLSHQTNNPGLKNNGIYPVLARVNLVDDAKYDQLLVFMNEYMSNAVDQYDSEKMFVSGSAQIYTMASGKKLVMNGLKNNKKKISVPLYLELPTSKVYQLQLNEYIMEDGLIILEDKVEGTMQDFTINDTYAFYASSGVLTNRFVLHFFMPDATITAQGPSNTWVDEEITINEGGSISVSSNGRGKVTINQDIDTTATEKGAVIVRDASGREVYNGQLEGTQTSIQIDAPSGVYFVEVSIHGEVAVKKIFIQQ